jgi:hypothetical protein
VNSTRKSRCDIASSCRCRIAAAFGAEIASADRAGSSQEHDMPNRGELAISVARPNYRPAVPNKRQEIDEALTILALCLIGLLASICLALYCQAAPDLPMLLDQIPIG